MRSVSPPRWAEALLARVLPPGAVGSAVRADLDSELEEVVRRRSARWARWWYAWEAIKIATHFSWSALRDTDDTGGAMDRLGRNVRIALRRVRRAPAFSATAIATIALGIGANVAIFSVVDAVLLEPLPYRDADRLVAIWEWHRPRDQRDNVANPGNYVAWREGSDAFDAMTAVALSRPVTVEAGGEPEEAIVQYAHPDFFSVLGLEARLGRTFLTDVERVETTEVVLSHRYWQERFAGAADVVGRTLHVNATPVVVVGVLPDEYVVFGEGTDLWASVALDVADQTNTGRWLMVLGRLAPEASLQAADAELKAIAAGLEEQFPEFNSGWTVNPVPLEREIVGDVRAALWVLLGAVGLLLLIACANVANLFLVRATERQREMAVRTSLGASGRTLAGQLLVESLVIAAAGAALGTVLAHVGTRWIATRMPDAFALPRVEAAGVDGTVLLFGALVTVVTTAAFGLVPALQAAATSPAETLAGEGRGASRRTGTLRNVLVVGEVAISLVLLAGAALVGRSFVALTAVDAGIDAEHVLVGRVNLAGEAYAEDDRRIAFFDELMERLSGRPGVAAVGGVTFLPMDGSGSATTYWASDRPVPEPAGRRAADIINITGDYFEAMGIELLQGRVFDARDRGDQPQRVIVNRDLAERYWPDGSAVGEQVVVSWIDDTPWEIIGVVEDVRVTSLDAEPREAIYIHYPQGPFFPWQQVVARAEGDPVALAAGVRATLADMDSSVPLGNVRLMDDIVAKSVARPRMTSALMLVFAALATGLSAVGLYGVLSYAVSQREREIGVRVALGAGREDVLRMVARQGGRMVLMGLALGAVLALGVGRLLESLLFGVAPSDPLSLSAAGLALAGVALLACLIPAWKAARVAPAVALRSE